MAFITAATATANSNGVALPGFPSSGALTQTLINAAIGQASSRAGAREPVYKLCIDLDADFDFDLDGNVVDIEIIQADATKLPIVDLTIALGLGGFRTHARPITTRDGINNKVKLQIAWD